MNIQISEVNNGFYYDEKKFFNWGDALINLVNSDFSELKKLVYIEEPKGKTYLDFFNPFFNLKIDSIHYEFICSSFIEFLEYYNNLSEKNIDSVLISDPHYFLADIQKFFFPLFYCQKQAKEILSCFIQESQKNNRLKNTSKYKKIYKENNSNINFNYETPITQFDVNAIYSNFKMSLKGSTIIQNHIFYSIPDFCNYELFKFIEKNVKIAECDYCHKYIRIKNANTHFCSKQCREEYEKSNPFFNPYRTTYKNYSKEHHDKYCPKPFANPNDSLRPQITKLYKEYKVFWHTENEQIKLEEFKKKLKQFK